MKDSKTGTVIIIGNKKDLWDKREIHLSDVEEYLEKYPNDLHFNTCSKIQRKDTLIELS